MLRHREDATFEDERLNAEVDSGSRTEPLVSTRNLSDSLGLQNDNRRADLAAGRDCSPRCVEKSPWNEWDRSQHKSDLELEREQTKQGLIASSSGFRESLADREDRMSVEIATGDGFAHAGATPGNFGDRARLQDDLGSLRGCGLSCDGERAMRPAEALFAENRSSSSAISEHERRASYFEQPASFKGSSNSALQKLLKMCDSPADAAQAAQPPSKLETALRGGPSWNAPGRR